MRKLFREKLCQVTHPLASNVMRLHGKEEKGRGLLTPYMGCN